MKKMNFTATVFSAFLIAGGAYAQNSDQGTPNPAHGSGDMMQDGPHASSNPNSDAETATTATGIQATKMKMCEKKWNDAQTNGTTGSQTRDQFVNSCMNMM
jgi:hypothetical protein